MVKIIEQSNINLKIWSIVRSYHSHICATKQIFWKEIEISWLDVNVFAMAVLEQSFRFLALNGQQALNGRSDIFFSSKFILIFFCSQERL